MRRSSQPSRTDCYHTAHDHRSWFGGCLCCRCLSQSSICCHAGAAATCISVAIERGICATRRQMNGYMCSHFVCIPVYQYIFICIYIYTCLCTFCCSGEIHAYVCLSCLRSSGSLTQFWCHGDVRAQHVIFYSYWRDYVMHGRLGSVGASLLLVALHLVLYARLDVEKIEFFCTWQHVPC